MTTETGDAHGRDASAVLTTPVVDLLIDTAVYSDPVRMADVAPEMGEFKRLRRASSDVYTDRETRTLAERGGRHRFGSQGLQRIARLREETRHVTLRAPRRRRTPRR
jgi:hypothetical protein